MSNSWKAHIAGICLAGLVAAGILIGSRGLTHFDPELTFYAIGSIMTAYAVAYRFTLWSQRPPTRVYLRRGFELLWQRARKSRASDPARDQELFRERGIPLTRPSAFALRASADQSGTLSPTGGEGRGEGDSAFTDTTRNHSRTTGSLPAAAIAVTDKLVAQNFIRQRSWYRWIMHLCLSGGCTLAFAITFPLVFGWVHFAPLAANAEVYQVKVLGFAVDEFAIHSVKGFVMFNMLNIAAVIVMIGLVMAAIRRFTDAGERATQKFFEDILPLLLIFAVTATGLGLTVSYKLLVGAGHHILVVVHLFSVLALLFYIPFGKLFHMFQRICSLCVVLYKKAGDAGPQAFCVRCGDDFTSAMHVADMKDVLDQLGFNYRFATPHGEVHYQDICPACRRRLVALNQGAAIGR